MAFFVHTMRTLSLVCAIAAIPAHSWAERTANGMPDDTVFVNPPTRFVSVGTEQ